MEGRTEGMIKKERRNVRKCKRKIKGIKKMKGERMKKKMAK
jgi:hypothetical protein